MRNQAAFVLMLLASVTACSAPARSPVPSASTPATGSASFEPTTLTGAPAPSPSLLAGFKYSDILRVEVNRLAVRQAPSLTSPLVQGYRDDAGTTKPAGDVRIDAGYFVSIQLGPLRNGDKVWYLVWPAEDARLHYNTGTWWDSNNDGTNGGVDPGWVAASVGVDQYLTLYRHAEPGEIEPDFLMVSGIGDYESGPQPRHDLFAFNWAAAVDDQASPCPFSVSLVPNDGGEPVVVVDTSTTDVEQGPLTIGSQIEPWGRTAGDAWDSFTVSVSSGCSWAVGLWPVPHD